MSIQDFIDRDMLEFTVKDDHAGAVYKAALVHIENLHGEAKIALLATYIFNEVMKMTPLAQDEFIKRNKQ